jgi:hypothetical protein
MGMRRTGIGTDFRIEGGLNASDSAAKAGHHVGDDVIGANAQSLPGDLKRQMSVTEMPCDPQQGRPIGRLDFKNRLGRSAHTDKATGIQLEPVAIGQMMRPREVEEKALPGVAGKPDAAAVPIDIREGYRIERSG